MTIAREIEGLRSSAAFWARETHTVLRFHGRDALAWLHNQTTNEVTGLRSGEGNLQALLDRTGRVQCFFHLFRWEEEAWLLIDQRQIEAIEARVESHLFLEEVEYENAGQNGAQICLEGPRALLVLDSLLHASSATEAPLPRAHMTFQPLELLGHDVLAFGITTTGEDGVLLIPAPDEGETLLEKLRDHGPELGATELSPEAQHAVLLESGLPDFPLDLDKGCVISETPLEALAVSYDKGCYLGQEVVARLKTYGTPKLALCGLLFDEDSEPPAVEKVVPIQCDGKPIGQLRRMAYSPTLQRWIARAYLGRDWRKPGQRLAITLDEGPVVHVTVQPLPIYAPRTREDYVQTLYHAALDAFEADAEDEREDAILLLRDVVCLAPDFEDAYETLGVILHRHHRVDEAIDVMQQLAAMNPNAVMAHTNLSVFYLSKGMIPEAEAEKALAAQLESRQALDARQAEAHAARERAQIRADAEERIGMFHEVLEIDPEDPVAIMGLGNAYLQLEQYEEAVPWFEQAVRLKKDYSAAFLNLGKCLEFSGKTEAALEAYGNGIAAASRKGDLMPLKEMERRRKALETQ